MTAIALVMLAAWSAVVTKPVSNMHSKPSGDADVVSQAVFGTNVDVMEEQDTFARVRTPDRYEGWIHTSALVRISDAGPKYGIAREGVRAARIVSLFGSVYREKSITRHRPLMTLPFDARIEVIGDEESGKWHLVQLPGRNNQGWIQGGDISFDLQAIATAEMLAASKRFLGLPYLWGGTSSFGFDCSGFTQMLVSQLGFLMPRDAHLQAAWQGVEAVERQHLEPGDLLFFGPSGERITHTGMYLGGGEFIHATSTGRPVVQISALGEEHWTKLFVCARRLKQAH